MPKNGDSLDKVLTAAGVDVAAAKEGLAKLDEAFMGEAGDIPDGALYRWVDEYFDSTRARAFFFALGKAWEAEIDLPDNRKWEKGPNAAEVKRKMNEEKAKKK